MHHAHRDGGGGWCLYADISLAVKKIQKKISIKKWMVIDLDVHQGNGICRDKNNFFGENLHIFDMFGDHLYPDDSFAASFINTSIDVYPEMNDEEYISTLKAKLPKAVDSHKPQLIVYNAGTDILKGDPLNGGVSVTVSGVVIRDEFVFLTALSRNVPIVMLLSGGYSSSSVTAVSKSINNLLHGRLNLINKNYN
eukprot:GHVL01004532.1.p1 GENE.GHVL01004532.1~~GHVL01004532.1.p1  ORF type:complete len:195 (+),score=51.24 GHVL01004532.1:374-958(+)